MTLSRRWGQAVQGLKARAENSRAMCTCVAYMHALHSSLLVHSVNPRPIGACTDSLHLNMCSERSDATVPRAIEG